MKSNSKKFFIVKLLIIIFVAVIIIVLAKIYNAKTPSKVAEVKTAKNIKIITESKRQLQYKIIKKNGDVKIVKGNVKPKIVKKSDDYGELHGLFKPQGKTKYQKYRNQLTVLRAIKIPLTRENIESLRDYAWKGANDRLGLHVKDEIFIKLEKNKTADKDHIQFLSELSADKTIDGDLRGYAVQHLRSEYVKANGELRKKIQKTLFDSLEDTQSDVSGTAILALSDLSKLYPNEFDKVAINNALVSLVENDSMHVPSRISVVQSVATMKTDSESVTNAVRDLAFNDPGDMTLRLAAIATIGEVGTKDDINELENILKKGHRLYKKATQKAIKKLKKINNKI